VFEGREEERGGGEEGREKREGEKASFFRLGFLVVAGALTNFHVQSTISKI
jgi:hypothetical protein